jgi:Gas vesicle protein
MRRGRRRRRRTVDPEPDASLLDLVDHVLNKGVVVTGDVMLGLADVDLIYLRLTALLCAADRVTPAESTPALVRRPRPRRPRR